MEDLQVNNKWINHEDDLFLFFTCNIKLEIENSKEAIFNLNLELHKLTYKYKLLMPLDIKYCNFHKIDPIEHYKEYLIHNSEDKLELFKINNYKFYDNSISRISNIFYRDTKGNLINKNVHYLFNGYSGNPISVESKTNYNFNEEFDKYSFDQSPLRVSNRHLSIQKNEVTIGFSLESSCSIWLDQTPNFKHMDKYGKITFFENSNNREIALRNTPRLNSLIKDIRKLLNKYDGACYLYDYRSYLNHDSNKNSKLEARKNKGLLIDGELIYENKIE